MTQLLAIGSVNGADRVGWQIAERLKRHSALPVCICQHPIDLLPHFRGELDLIILDALSAPNLADGELIWIDPEQLQPSQCLYGHGLTLYDVLQLAQITGQLPEGLRILGVNIAHRLERNFTEAEIDELMVKCQRVIEL